MKVAVVLWAGAPAILRQAGEIKTLLADSAQEPAQVELWLLHHSHPPEFIPDIAGPVSGINLIAVENPPSPESILPRLEQLYHRQPVDLLLFASDGLGAELATRLAYRLNGSSCLKVEQLTIEPQTVAVDRAAYGHNMNARFRLRLKPYCLAAAKVPGRPVESIRLEPAAGHRPDLDQPPCAWIKAYQIFPDSAATGLDQAEIVLAVGYGAGSQEKVALLENIAASLGAELGASRPAVVNGWASINRLIGISGVSVSPAVCIAAGVSGSSAFSVGISQSEFIVAINIDPSAPIFHWADVGIVDDLFELLIELERLVKHEKRLGQAPEPEGNSR